MSLILKKFERTDEYEKKLFEQAMFDEKRVIKDAEVIIAWDFTGKKLKALCRNTNTYLQFPTKLRKQGKEFIADVVEVKREEHITPYYRAMKGSIRDEKGNVVG